MRCCQYCLFVLVILFLSHCTEAPCELWMIGCPEQDDTAGPDSGYEEQWPWEVDIGPQSVTLPDVSTNGSDFEVPQARINGSLILPPGFPQPAESLTLSSIYENAIPVGNGGRFETAGSDGGKQVLIVNNADGNLMMLGWVKKGEGNEISTKTTAAVLLMLYGGGFFLPVEAWNSAATLLLNAYETRDLASFLDEKLAADPNYLHIHIPSPDDPDPALYEQYGDTADELLDKIREELYSIVPQASQAQLDPRLVLINPAGTKSGITVLIGDRDESVNADVNQITLMNEWRRRAYLFIELLTDSQATQMQSFELQGTAGLNGVLGSLTQLWEGKVAYAPIYYGPIGLGQTYTDEDKLTYRVIAVGPGNNKNTGVALTADQISKWEFICLKGFLVDIFMPVVLGVIDLDWVGQIFASDGFGLFVTALINNVYQGNVGDLLTAIKNGDLWTAVSIFMNNIWNSTGFREYLRQSLSIYIMNKFQGHNSLEWQKFNKWTKLLGPLKLADTILAVADFGVVARDWIQATDIVDWEVTVVPPKVTLTPAKSKLSCGEKGAFKVTVKNAGQDLTKELFYKFTNTAQHGTLTTDVNSAYKNNFEVSSTLSNSQMVYYTVKSGKVTVGGTDEITVEVWMLTTSATNPNKKVKQYMGTAKAKVEIEKNCTSNSSYVGSDSAFRSGCTQVLTAPSVVYPGDEVTVTAKGSYGGVCGSIYVWMSYAVKAEIDGEESGGMSGSGLYDFCYWSEMPQPVAPGGAGVWLPDDGTHTITFTISEDIKCPICVRYDPYGAPCYSNPGNTKILSGPAVVMGGTGGTHGWDTVKFFEIMVDEEK